MNPEIQLRLLKIRNLIADKEFEIACANREQALGGWLTDHAWGCNGLTDQINALVDELTDMLKRAPNHQWQAVCQKCGKPVSDNAELCFDCVLQ